MGRRIANNSASVFGGGIAAAEDPGGGPAQLVLERCLLYGNEAPIGAALSTINAEASVRSCTIVDNTVTSLNGSVVDLENTVGHAVEIGQCIIAFNAGDALGCFLGAMPQLSCCDIFENSDDSICGKDLGGNFSVDPAFCDMDQSDFHLLEGSPCAPLNSPPGCDLIGALPAMCVNSVHPSTWGAVKHGFLPEVGK